MFSLFTQYNTDISYPISMPSQLDYVIRTYQRDVNKVVEYYKTSVRAVDHQHLLSRIIGNVAAPTHYPIISYMNAVEARSQFVAKTFRLTSPINFGTVHYGVFGAPMDAEIILSEDTPFSVLEDYSSNNKWMDIRAVRCIEHQNSSLVPHTLNGEKKTSAVGLRVYSVNIPLLLLQFKYFAQYQLSERMANGGSVLDKTHFVAMYVLPNMIYSDMDLQMVNRFQNKVSGRPMDRSYVNLPIAISDYSNKVDDIMEQVVKNLTLKRFSYEGYLRGIPTIFSTDAQAALQVPDMAPTRQVQWALIVSRLKHIRSLIEVGGDIGRKANTSLLNSIRLDFKYMLRDRQFESVLGKYYSSMDFETIYEECMADIKAIGVAK